MAMTNVYQIASDGRAIPKEITGTVGRTERIGMTYYGNPIYRVYLDAVAADGSDWSGIYRISDNASIVYGIENTEYREEAHTFRLTRAGRLSGYARKVA